MSARSPKDITALLVDWKNGDESALHALMPLVYDELHRQAHRYLRGERTGLTLQTTDLVHEGFLRLANHRKVDWKERAHFYAIAAKVMRRILVEHARSRKRVKRGGEVQKISTEDGAQSFEPISVDWERDARSRLDMIALDEALKKFEAIDPRKAMVVEMRFFAGMGNKEIAEVLGVTQNTVITYWNFAEAWLRRELAI